MDTYGVWNGYMRSYDFLLRVEGYRRNLSDIAEAAAVRPGERVLDAGSGTGNLSLLLKARKADVVSCDFSAAALAEHRRKDPKARQLQASLEEPLPLAAGEFDVVCCASVLFALSDKGCRLAASEFLRVLRPGGRLAATVPAPTADLRNLVRLYFGGLRARYGSWRGRLRGLPHLPALLKVIYYNHKLKNLPDWRGYHAFSEKELEGLFSDAGFAHVRIGRTYGDCFFLVTARRNKPLGRSVSNPRA